MDETGDASSGGVYWQAQVYVTGVSAGQVTSVSLCPCYYGIPGGNAGKDTFGVGGNPQSGNGKGGTYLNILLPSNPISQSGSGGSTSGSGTGASFNVTWSSAYQSGWPDQPTWASVVTLKNTFNSNTGVPIFITETGEHSGTGIVGSPWMSAMTSWCDTNGVSIISFCYNPVPGFYSAYGTQQVLTNGTDTLPNYSPGYGAFVYNWTTTHA
jgi:hypothetical protein